MLSADYEMRKMRSTNRVTLRLPNNIIEKLKKEAERKDIPLNSVITKILSKSIMYDMEFNSIPTITMSNVLFSKIMNNVNDTTLEKIASEGPEVIKKLFTIIGIEYNIENIVEKYFVIFSKYCGWFKFTYETNESNYRFVFETPLGKKWTKFLSLYVRNILESLKIHIDTESIHDNVILFQFKSH